jgi:hypothetical protein
MSDKFPDRAEFALAGIRRGPIPEGADQFIFWASDFTVDDEDGNPVPVPRPISEDVPNIWWA